MTAPTLATLDARLSAVEAKIDPDAELVSQAEDMLHCYAGGYNVLIENMRSIKRDVVLADSRAAFTRKCIAAGIPVRVIARVLHKTERGVRAMRGRV